MAKQLNRVKMTDLEFSAILDWWMCSDPWPVTTEAWTGDPKTDVANCDKEHHDTCRNWLDRECKARGYDNWVEAYHEFTPDKENENA